MFYGNAIFDVDVDVKKRLFHALFRIPYQRGWFVSSPTKSLTISALTTVDTGAF